MAGSYDPNDQDDHDFMANYLSQIAPDSLASPSGGQNPNMDYAQNGAEDKWNMAQNNANIPSGSPLDPNLGQTQGQGIAMATAMSQPTVSQDADQTVMADPNTGMAPTDSPPTVAGGQGGPETYSLPDQTVTGNVPHLSNGVTLQAAQDAASAAPTHHGLFHVSGTLRDVLGTLGDAFLTQAGKNSVYAPKREQEKLSDALTGFNQPVTYNTDGSVKNDPFQSALTRVSSVPGGADMASKLYEQNMANQVRRANISSQIDARDFRNKSAHEVTSQNVLRQIGGKFAAAGTDPRLQSVAYQQSQALAKANGVDPAEIGLHDNMTPAEMAVLGRGTISANQQYGLAARQQGADAATSKAQSYAKYVDKYKPSSDRPAPAPTVSNVVAQVLNKARTSGVSSLNPAEQAVYNKNTNIPKKTSRNFTGNVPPLTKPGFAVTK